MKIAGVDYRQPKRFRSGTHRSRPPEQTLAEYVPLMPRFGITRLANITGLDRIGLPVYTAIRPNSRSLSTSQGKGIDVASAKASALMESIESWHAERVELPLRHDSYSTLRASRAVLDIARLAKYTNATTRPDVPMLWVEGYDLIRHEACWVPFEAVTNNFVMSPGSMSTSTFVEGTNGLASGNHLLEAIEHGLCEVIERDAVRIADVRSTAFSEATRLDLASVRDPLCDELVRMIQRAGLGVMVWDITSNIAVPTYRCSLFELEPQPQWRPMTRSGGFGCHLSPAVALMRALTEAVQSRVTLIAGSRDDAFYEVYRSGSNEDDRSADLARLAAPTPVQFAARTARATDTFEDDVQILLDELQAAGIAQAVVVDLTRPGIGIPVVKVVVPGLDSINESFVALGERARAAKGT